VKCLRVGCEKDKILRREKKKKKKKKKAQNKTTTALIEMRDFMQGDGSSGRTIWTQQ